jgi:hypothetical protein
VAVPPRLAFACASARPLRSVGCYKWIERKKLPAHKMGRLWKFKASQVDTWVQTGKAAAEVKRQ